MDLNGVIIDASMQDVKVATEKENGLMRRSSNMSRKITSLIQRNMMKILTKIKTIVCNYNSSITNLKEALFTSELF